ncbi:MAG TPA: hypothetical protein VKM72_35550 [Thermoanaerobaculia bacterium]|nr:hypothetical protein [Thermoanaerobaculia bacterium]
MPGFLYHVGAAAICPHGGQVSTTPGNPRVKVSSQLVATMADQSMIAACAFTAGPKPQPCVRVQWLVPAVRVRAGGQPVLLQDSVGLCLSAEQIPQGPPTIIATQPRVKGM